MTTGASRGERHLLRTIGIDYQGASVPAPRSHGRHIKSAVALCALVTIMTVTTACSSGTPTTSAMKPPSDGVLVFGLNGDIGQPPDPDVYYANNGVAIIQNVYQGLVKYKDSVETPEIAPALATSWTVDPANTVFTFQLRRGVMFHDGTPFTSAAIKTSFDRRLAVAGGPSYMVEGVQSISTPDDFTAVIKLNAPNSAFLDYLASSFGPKMLSPTGLAKNAGSDNAQTYLSTHDLGTGPYELTKAEIGREYDLTAYPGYWGEKSPFTTVKLSVYTDVSTLGLALDHGDIAGVVNALPASNLSHYKTLSTVSNYFLPTLGAALVTVNPSKGFFSTQPARMAFLRMIDQQQLVDQVMGETSEVATTMYGKGMIPGGADNQAIAFDPKVMQAYVKTLPADTEMTIGYATGNDNAQNISNILASQLQAMGIKAAVQGYTTSTVFSWPQDPTKGPDAFVDGSNGPDGANPFMWGHVFWDKSGGINYFLCDSPRVDAMLDDAVRTGNDATYVQAGAAYGATGCYMTLAYNKSWVVAQKWLTNVAKAHHPGSYQLNFNQLGIAPES
jgi:peptide/nickel transport system substrate-binding protein